MKSMYKASIIFGAERDRNGQPVLPGQVMAALDAVKQALIIAFHGCTVERLEGAYMHSNGGVTTEKSIAIWTLLENGDSNTVRQLAQYLCDTLRQESVLVMFEPVCAEFVHVEYKASSECLYPGHHDNL